MPIIMAQGGMQRSGQIVTTTGEVIDGVVLTPSWWRVETDLGMLSPSPEALKSITFLKKGDEPPPATSPPDPKPTAPAPVPTPTPGF